MIKTIQGGIGINVIESSSSTYVPRSYNSNANMTGQMMYDVDTQCMKVYDGSNWQPLYPSTSTITLDSDTISLLEWARMKRDEELKLQKLAETNSAVRDLIQQIKEKEEQLMIVQTLIK